MSRVIKFRVWDKASRRWLFPNPDIGDWSGGSGDAINLWCYKDTGLSVHSVSSNMVEITQFTGLLDSKGREIYEGDILKGKIATGHSKLAKRRNWICEVKWCDWNAGWIMHGKTDARWRFFPAWAQCEVIGNIFENSDLLK
jgi:uncharacterized phage protein (TIGR01671 family)